MAPAKSPRSQTRETWGTRFVGDSGFWDGDPGHPAVELRGFDQDLWARVGHYASWKPQDALAMFRLLREANLRMFAHLTPEQWQRHGVHSERGKLTVRDLCCHMAAHDINHIEQVRRILAR